MSQSESCRVAHCMYVEIELKKIKIDFESLVLRKFRKITAISHPCNRVQITCNTSSAYHVQHAVCHMVRSDISAIKFDRVGITFVLAYLYWLKPLTFMSQAGESQTQCALYMKMKCDCVRWLRGDMHNNPTNTLTPRVQTREQ